MFFKRKEKRQWSDLNQILKLNLDHLHAKIKLINYGKGVFMYLCFNMMLKRYIAKLIQCH